MKASSSNFLNVVAFLLSSLITQSSFMSISWLVLELRKILFLRDLTRNPEIGNTHVWVLSNIWGLEWVGDTKFGMNASIEKLLQNASSQLLSFLSYWGKTKTEGNVPFGRGFPIIPNLSNSFKFSKIGLKQ